MIEDKKVFAVEEFMEQEDKVRQSEYMTKDQHGELREPSILTYEKGMRGMEITARTPQ